jgi:divalent metal cation (Fe/Co/Zn/Cd) transporter
VDPFGAILISLVIIGRWGGIIKEQAKKIVGFTAPPEFVSQVERENHLCFKINSVEA